MKRGIKLFLFILLFLFLVPIVKAAPTEESDCYKVNNMLDEYDAIVSQIENLQCGDTLEGSNDTELLSTCENLYINKSYYLSILFRENDNNTCPSARLTEVVDANKDDCSLVLESSLKDIADRIMNIFYILAPFLLIIFGSLDFAKIVVSPNPENIKKNRKNFVKRLAATILLLLTPYLVNIILKISPNDLALDSNLYTCKKPFIFSTGSFDIKYVQKTKKQSASRSSNITVNSEGTQAMLDAAKQLMIKFKAENWSYNGCSGSNIEYSINCPDKTLVCADLIAQVLYLGNIFTADEINSTKYNGCCGLYHFLIEQGWVEITNYEDLQPGDVVFFGKTTSTSHGGKGKDWFSKHIIGANGLHLEFKHTALYAGNDEWYDTGSIDSIRAGGTIKVNRKGWFVVGLRMP